MKFFQRNSCDADLITDNKKSNTPIQFERDSDLFTWCDSIAVKHNDRSAWN